MRDRRIPSLNDMFDHAALYSNAHTTEGGERRVEEIWGWPDGVAVRKVLHDTGLHRDNHGTLIPITHTIPVVLAVITSDSSIRIMIFFPVFAQLVLRVSKSSRLIRHLDTSESIR